MRGSVGKLGSSNGINEIKKLYKEKALTTFRFTGM